MPGIFHRHDQGVALEADRHGIIAARGCLGNQADSVRIDGEIVFGDELVSQLHGQALCEHVGTQFARLNQRVFESTTTRPLCADRLFDIRLAYVTEIDQNFA